MAVLLMLSAPAPWARADEHLMDQSMIPPTAARMAGVAGWEDIAAGLLPSVVNISNIHYDPAGPGQTMPARRESLGSGFVIDASGIILTNKHVVADAAEISVTLSDGTVYTASLLHEAALVDVALLKIEPTQPLPPVHFGDSDKLRIGEPVLAIGNPLGFGNSVSAGIVSALDRDIHLSPYDAFIQTDAAINHGNSGGPLFDRAGEVVGMDTALYSPTDAGGSIGLGFSIPSNDLQFVIAKLLEYGWVRSGWIGVTGQTMTGPLANAVGLRRPEGAILTDIDPKGPAARAGLRIGDVVLKVGVWDVRDVRLLNRAVSVQPVGSTAPLTYWRDGAMQSTIVTIDDSPIELKASTNRPMLLKPPTLRVASDPSLGLSLAALSPEVRARFKLDPKAGGVVVTGVADNSRAADRGILAGDVILQVDHEPVTSPAAFRQRIASVWSTLRGSDVLALVQTEKALRWVALPIGP
jgi:serine protease Do